MFEDEQRSFHTETTVVAEAPAAVAVTEPAWPPPPRPRPSQGPSKATRILAISLAALLVASGLSFMIYAATNQYGLAVGSQRRLNVNATVRGQVASQATLVSSLQQTAQPLATAQARVFASATAQAQSTTTTQAQATATATALEDVLTKATSGTPALDDPLSDNSLNNVWDVGGTDNNNTGCKFADSGYEVQEARQGFLQPCFASNTNFSNFVYQVSMTISSGNQGGLIFRGNRDRGQYYVFRIDTNGGYALELYNGGKYLLLVQGANAAITTGTGVANDLTVLANKQVLSFFVNSTYLGSITDKTLSGGQVGVVALNQNLPTTVDFSDAKVWKLA